jgi:hypothetical protein
MIRSALTIAALLLAILPAAAETMTGMQGLPDFGAAPTIVSARDGAWSDPGTWSPARVPVAGDLVRIVAGTTVAYDLGSSPSLAVVRIDGELRFSVDRDTSLTAATVYVTESGALEVGSVAAPVPASHHAELVIADVPIDTGYDPAQFGGGIVGLGRVTMHGAARRASFVRLAAEPHAGDTQLMLAAPVSGWLPGDRLILPDSRCLEWYDRTNPTREMHREEPTLAALSSDGLTLTLSAPIAYDHPGCHDENGAAIDLPFVADLSRNVEIRSENPAGTRGHVLMTYRADVDIRWVGFRDLGRTTEADLDSTTFDASGVPTHIGTNQIGRYPLHAHHLYGPTTAPADGFQFTFIGNAIDGGSADNDLKWGIAIHDSHYGVVHGNVVYNCQGAGIVTEDGSETHNLIDSNFVARVTGTGGRTDYGRDGAGFWLRGINNWVNRNVATDIGGGIYCYGYNIFQYYLDNVTIPTGPGLEPSLVVDPHTLPILGFDGNEVYGVVPNGITYWWLGSYGGGPDFDRPDAGVSVVRNFRAWNYYQWGIFAYPSQRVVFDHMALHGDYDQLAGGHGVEGAVFSDYWGSDVIFRDCEFVGLSVGIEPSPQQSPGTLQGAERCRFRCDYGVSTFTLWSVSAFGDGIPPRTVIERDCQFDLSPYHGTAPTAIRRLYNVGTNPVQLDRMLVYGYQGSASDAFELFFAAQEPDVIVPQTTYNDPPFQDTVQHPGCPVAGLTNSQSWATYGIAIAGAVAPDSAVPRDGLIGLASPIDPGSAPSLLATPSPVAPPTLPADEDGGFGTTAGGTTAGGSTGDPATGGTAGGGGATAGGGSQRCGLGGLAAVLGLLALAARRRRA